MIQTKKQKIIFHSILFSTILYLGILAIEAFKNSKKEYYLNVQSQLLAVKYKTSYKYFKIMADDIALMYGTNKNVIKLLSLVKNADKTEQAELRRTLYKKLIKNYKRLNHMGITQVHFHLPNNKSFLRMYKPEVFGDNVTDIKDAVVLTNQTKTMHSGFETCLFMAGLRFVYPLFNAKKEYLGCVEIAYSTQELLKSIQDDFVHDSHILISKDIAAGTIVQKELDYDYKQSWEDADYLIETSTHKKIGKKDLYAKLDTPKVHDAIKKGIASKKPFSLATEYNYHNIIMTYLPLQSTTKTRNIAYIVVYTESDYLSNLQLQYNYILILFISVLALLYLFGFYVIFSQAKLKELALYDSLTKLPNRALFKIELNNEINRAMRYEHNIALLFLDLDGFKAVNDTYGHHTGDELLIFVAKTITSRLRKNDMVSRLGGDEFTIILNDIGTPQQAVELAEHIIKDINKEIILNHEVIQVGASIGVSMYPKHSKDIDDLIKYADKMMYISKENGKNQVTLYKEEYNV